MKAIINEWRNQCTTVTSPRTGTDRRIRKELIKEATEGPAATLKELQKYMRSTLSMFLSKLCIKLCENVEKYIISYLSETMICLDDVTEGFWCASSNLIG